MLPKKDGTTGLELCTSSNCGGGCGDVVMVEEEEKEALGMKAWTAETKPPATYHFGNSAIRVSQAQVMELFEDLERSEIILIEVFLLAASLCLSVVVVTIELL